MTSYRNIRVIPVVLVAIFSLAVLKVAGLVLDGGYVFDYTPQQTKRSWAQDNLNFPGREDVDITGSTHGEPKAAAKEAAPKEEAPKPAAPDSKPDGVVYHPEENQQPVSPSERAILERLQERRTELEARARELDMRESLIKAAEKRLEGRLAELKDLEARVNAALQIKDEGEATRFKNLVTMYQNMKAKDAAKIFDRLDLRILVEVATQLNPRRMSDILAQMTPEAAERLTVELATHSKDKTQPADLPKIEGRPNSN